MSNTSASFHGITSLAVKYTEAPESGGWIQFVFRVAQGGWHDVTLHVERPLEIAGAEFINLMAAHEKEKTT